VRTLEVGNSSALGGALRAANTLGGVAFPALYERFAAPHPSLGATPSMSFNYSELRERFALEVDRLSRH
jgi:hypothetical protein